MVFTNLGVHEKQAFFDLLDEYFTSRPELLSSLGPSSSGAGAEANSLPVNSRAAASAVHSALAANPEATAKLISSGLKHGAQNSSVKNSPFASAASNPAVANSIGRVAAASIAFQGGGQRNTPPPLPASRSRPPPPPAARNMPPALPRRTSQEDDASPSPPPSRSPPPGPKTAGTAGLVSGRSFGDVNTTSVKAGLFSIRHSTANKSKPPPAAAPPIPSALAKRQNNFAPPPLRRITSDTAPLPQSERTPSPEPEPEEQGEWAEALYDYDSGEAGDLVLHAHERVKVVSKDSGDWWTGEANGKTGLFPASYVQVL